MPARELIHVSFGSLPARISTHYLNTQTGYFDYSSNAPEPLVDHDVAWSEGQDGRGYQRFTPRWIAYDVRQGFSGLRNQEVYDDEDDDAAIADQEDPGQRASTAGSSAWQGSTQMMKTQNKKSSTVMRNLTNRQARGEDFEWDAELENEFDSDDELDEEESKSAVATADATRGESDTVGNPRSTSSDRSHTSYRQRPMQPWSSRLLFEPHPRSLVPVTAAGNMPLVSMPNQSSDESDEGIEIFETFEQGWSRAREWERDNETLDNNFRSLLEASEQPQGFNVASHSSDAWSGFSCWNLEQIADEYPKLDRLVWSTRWGRGLGDILPGEELSSKDLRLCRIRSVNEAVSLALSIDLSSLTIPIDLPALPRDGSEGWTRHIRQDKRLRLHSDENYTAALLASQLETATLGMRLRHSPTSASTLVSQLKWRGDTPLAALGGCLFLPPLSGEDISTAKPLDPIEALLAARGYNPRPNQDNGKGLRYQKDPAEQAREGASRISKSWIGFSPSPQWLIGRKKASKASGSVVQPSIVKPFAMHAVSRQTTDSPSIRSLTTSSTEEWLTGQEAGSLDLEEPLSRSLFAPLSQPIPASFPRLFKDLSQEGRPLHPQHSSSGSSSKKGNHSRTQRPRWLPGLSTLSTTPSSLSHILHAHSVLTHALHSHSPLSSFGLGSSGGSHGAGAAASEETEGRVGGRDGIKELLERIEELRGAYEVEGVNVGIGQEDEEDERDGGKGTDEEWEDDVAGQDDDLDWD